MGLISSIWERRSLEQDLTQWPWKATAYTGNGTTSLTGRTVTDASAMRASAVFACVRVRAETVASLPWPVYRRLAGGGKERDASHPLYRLLHDQPNPEQTAMEARENAVAHLDLWGHAYFEIEWDERNEVSALWPLHPATVSEEKVNGQLWYVITLPTGERRGLPAYRVWHTRGFMGQSVISQAREAIGLELASEEYGARFFSNDSRPAGILKSPNRLTPESAKSSKDSWEAAHGGLSNAHRVAVLQEGLEWQSIGMPNADAQFLELRQFQVTDIARFFRVPPHMIADLSKATFSNIEHQSIDFVTHCIRPICVRFEQSALTSLFAEDERATWFAEHVIEGLLRGDMKSRFDAYAIARNWGWLNADEVRELENQNPLPDGQGKTYLMPMNMTSASNATAANAGQQDEAEPAEGAVRAVRRLVENALQRALRREETDVLRQARKLEPEALTAWLQRFYTEHQQFVTRSLGPVAEAASDLGLGQDLAQMAREYAAENLVALEGIVARGGDVVGSLQASFDGWKEGRAHEVAARLS